MTEKSPIEPQDRAGARQRLSTALGELDLDVGVHQLESLLSLAELLHVWGARINLTGHKTLFAIVQGMVVESAALTSALPEIESLADLGSGAGFPGLPIAILRPDCTTTLVEAREKRHHFQRAALRELQLENVTAVQGRAETLTPVRHAAAIAQAMAQPERALEWMLPWVADGGRVLIPGSSTPPKIALQGGIAFEDLARYTVPISRRERTLWIGRATS